MVKWIFHTTHGSIIEFANEEMLVDFKSKNPNLSGVDYCIDELVDQIADINAAQYINFGINLWSQLKCKVFAINTLSIADGWDMPVEDLIQLLTISDTLERMLKTGALNTAKQILPQLKAALPRYGMVADWAVAQIDLFMTT